LTKREASSLPDLSVQYADYAVWQRHWLHGPLFDRLLSYWKHQLQDVPPVLELRADHPRPENQSHRGAIHSTVLPVNLLESLRILSRQEGVTLFMTLLAAYEVLLWRCSGQNDFIVGTDVANRNRIETESLIGFFVNVLPLRARMAPKASFTDLLAQVRETALGAYAHQDVPLEKLVEELQPQRSLSHNPLVQVLFVLQNTPKESLQVPGLTIARLGVVESTKFDLALFLHEVEQGIHLTLQYNTDLFEPGTIRTMAAHYETLLSSIIARPDVPLNALAEILAEADRRQRLLDEKEFEEASMRRLKRLKRRTTTS
jgi:non-ribosomal peptide synthetase component F